MAHSWDVEVGQYRTVNFTVSNGTLMLDITSQNAGEGELDPAEVLDIMGRLKDGCVAQGLDVGDIYLGRGGYARLLDE